MADERPTTTMEEVTLLRQTVDRLQKHALELAHDLDLAKLVVMGSAGPAASIALAMKTKKGTDLAKAIDEDRARRQATRHHG